MLKKPHHPTLGGAIAALLLAGITLPAAAAAPAIELVAVTTPVELADHITHSNLAKECSIGKLTGDKVLEALAPTNPGVAGVASLPALTGQQRALRLRVSDMYGLGGGGWSGAKWMLVRAELVGPSGVLAQRDFRRATKSLMGIASGTCPMMEKIASTLGQDIKGWLAKAASAETGSQPLTPAAEATEPAPAASGTGQ